MSRKAGGRSFRSSTSASIRWRRKGNRRPRSSSSRGTGGAAEGPPEGVLGEGLGEPRYAGRVRRADGRTHPGAAGRQLPGGGDPEGDSRAVAFRFGGGAGRGGIWIGRG